MNFEKGTKTLEKNLWFLFSAREKVLNSFKSILFPIKNLYKITTRVPTPELATESEVATKPIKATKATKEKTNRKISSLKLHEKFLNEIKNEEKNINDQIFNELFNDQYS